MYGHRVNDEAPTAETKETLDANVSTFVEVGDWVDRGKEFRVAANVIVETPAT